MIKVIFAHDEKRRRRTVHFDDGTAKDVTITRLQKALIESREK